MIESRDKKSKTCFPTKNVIDERREKMDEDVFFDEDVPFGS